MWQYVPRVLEAGSLIVAVLAILWAVYTHFEQRKERRRHAETVEELRQRSEAITELSGVLREIRHCTDDHGGEDPYQRRIDGSIKEARSFVLRNERLFGEDVIAVVQKETELAGEVFLHKREAGADDEELDRLHDVRAERVAVLERLGKQTVFPPPPGSLVDR
jgi:hypothetical protein